MLAPGPRDALLAFDVQVDFRVAGTRRPADEPQPELCRRLHDPAPLVPSISARLQAAAEQVDRDFP